MDKELEIIERAVDSLAKGNGSLAESLFLEASSIGSGCAAYNLSEMYKSGIFGVEKSQDKQQYWLNQSIHLGFEPKATDDPTKFKRAENNLTLEDKMQLMKEAVITSSAKKGWLEKFRSLFS